MWMCAYVCYFWSSSKTLCNISSFTILAKSKQRLMCFPKITNIWRSFFSGSMRNVGRPSSVILLLCTSTHKQICDMLEQEDGQKGCKRKAVSEIKRTVSFFQSACGMSTKTAPLFSLCPVPLISLYSSCSFLVLILLLFFLPLPPNKWNQKIRKRDEKINKYFSYFLSFATVTKGCFCLICSYFCF